MRLRVALYTGFKKKSIKNGPISSAYFFYQLYFMEKGLGTLIYAVLYSIFERHIAVNFQKRNFEKCSFLFSILIYRKYARYLRKKKQNENLDAYFQKNFKPIL